MNGHSLTQLMLQQLLWPQCIQAQLEAVQSPTHGTCRGGKSRQHKAVRHFNQVAAECVQLCHGKPAGIDVGGIRVVLCNLYYYHF